MVRIKIKITFNPIMARLIEEYLKYAVYLKNIKVKVWARYIFPVRRWLYDISNVNELINSI